jgi:very-short-patch-repair endonuclease
MDVLRHRARDLRNNATGAERALWHALRGCREALNSPL